MRNWRPAFVGYAAHLNCFTSVTLHFPRDETPKWWKKYLDGRHALFRSPVRALHQYVMCHLKTVCNAAVVSDTRYNPVSSWRTTERTQFDAWQRQVFSSSPLLFPCGGYRIPCMISHSGWTVTLPYDLDEFSPLLPIIPVKSSEY